MHKRGKKQKYFGTFYPFVFVISITICSETDPKQLLKLKQLKNFAQHQQSPMGSPLKGCLPVVSYRKLTLIANEKSSLFFVKITSNSTYIVFSTIITQL